VLSRVEVTNFQSLPRAVVPLGRLTVVTGPTGAGKSGLFRALRLLAFNARGTSYVTAGESSCSVATGNDAWACQVTRSPSRGRNEYVTAVLGEDGQWSRERYTKLDKKVPGPVASLLALSDLNFAGQHDPPFLLSEPGTVIARKLGDLTNVSLVYGAAAEVNRARKQLARDLAAARERHDALLAEVQEFAGLGGRREAAERAARALARAQEASAAASRLRALGARLEAAQAAAAAARAEAARREPPSLEDLELLAGRAARLRSLAGALEEARAGAARHAAAAERAAADERAALAGVHQALDDAGQCPTCGREVA
jgi:exonuclease SbcC